MRRPAHTLLLAFAHPDDESYLAAGTVARLVAEATARVILFTATRGEAATLGPDAGCTRAELGEVRAAELRRAGSLLGIARTVLLDHPDGRLESTDAVRIRRQLVSIIRDHRPGVVLTFDPNGENHHPDHIAISRFVSDAISVAADPRWLPDLGKVHQVERLVWTTPTPVWTMLRNPVRALSRWPGVDFLVDTGRYAEVKRTALLAHRSQAAGIHALLLGRGDADLILSREAFRQAWGPRISRPPGDDLFEGVGSTEVAGSDPA